MELTTVAVAFRSVIQIDDQMFYAGKFLPSFLPPQKNAVDHKVAGFVVGAEKQERSASNRLQNAAWNQFLLEAHIVIQHFDSHNPTRTPTSGVFANMDDRLGVYAYSHGFSIRIRQRVYLPDVFKDCVGFCGFF